MGKQIVFLESYSTTNIYKIAREFKKKGYETILIRLLEPTKENKIFFSDAYTKIIDINLSYFQLKIKNLPNIFFSLSKNSKTLLSNFFKISKLEPYAIIGRATPSWPTAIFRILFRKTPLIYFPMDIRALFYPNVKIAKEVGRLSKFEIKCERFCFEKADGIIHKNDPQGLNFLNGRMLGDNIKLPELRFVFPPYCSNEFITPINKDKLSKKDKEIHFVYIGSGITSKDIYIKIFEDSNIADIINQGIHFHLYIASNTASQKNSSRESFINEYKNVKNFDYFHIHDSLNPREIVKEISKYDFGLWPPFHKKQYSSYDLDYKFAIGNKFSTYLEAGIPFFYSPKLLFIDKLIKEYKIPLALSADNKRNNIRDLKKRIKRLDYKDIEKNIVVARKDFNLQKHFSELEDFIKKVVAEKKSK